MQKALDGNHERFSKGRNRDERVGAAGCGRYGDLSAAGGGFATQRLMDGLDRHEAIHAILVLFVVICDPATANRRSGRCRIRCFARPRLPVPMALRFRLLSSGDIQRPNQVFPGVGCHSDSNGEKKKRGDDQSNSDCSEPTIDPTLGFSRMSDRDILDQESDHIAAGGEHHPDSKAHEGGFEGRIVPGYSSGLVGDSEIA
jgi:hypothetical protein